MRPRVFGMLSGLAFALSRALAGQPVPLGPEFQVNTNTTSFPGLSSAAMDPAGEFTVVWQETVGAYPVFTNIGIFGQRFSTSGAKLGGEFQVNTSTTGQWSLPNVAKDSDGNFIVVWEANSTPFVPGIFARRFDSSGAALGDEFPVTPTGTRPSAAFDRSGNFIIVWAYGAVLGQRYDSTGALVGSQFQANTSTSGAGVYPRVGIGPSGDFVVAWAWAYATEPGIFARRFESSGSPQGGEIEVTKFLTTTPGFQRGNTSLAMDARGNFTVTWDAWEVDGDGSSGGIFARAFERSGIPRGNPFPVNTYTTNAQFDPSVGMDGDGDFVIAWKSALQDGSGYGVFGQRYASSGDPLGAEFPINTNTTNSQEYPSVAVNPSGRLAVAWLNRISIFDPTLGVFARVGDLQPGRSMAVDAHAGGTKSNLNGVFEPDETVLVEPAWRNVLANPTDVTGSASGLTGPSGPVYTIDDASANYGTVQPGTTSDCYGAKQDCYRMSISGPRPAPHWDATFDESRTDGLARTWTLHVGASFTDVAPSSLFYPFIENIFHHGVTGGCGGTDYCPDAPTLRKQMAVFVLTAKESAGFVPPPAVGIFTDVPASDPFAPWIEELYNRGVVAGCGPGPAYCPDAPVLRQQMAVFLLKTLEGSAYTPPLCASIFQDVGCPGTFANWIEELYNRNVTGGCSVSPLLYCPTNDVTRGQMAPFLVKTFDLLLYGN